METKGSGTENCLHFGTSFDFFTSLDPISVYVRTHMTPASTFKISDDNVIRCYVEFRA